MWLISMFEISEKKIFISLFYAYLETDASRTLGDNLPLPEWTSVHVHICGDAGDVYTEMDAGTCTLTQPHKCDMKLEYI